MVLLQQGLGEHVGAADYPGDEPSITTMLR